MVEPGENIFLFIPNLIGYGRILLALLSFYWMPTDYSRAFWCYALSAFLDAWDGHAARYFRQSTKFGALLDQLTDRCGTMCLLVTLSYFYPKYMFCFQVSMSIDIASHWLHTQVNVWINRCYLKLLFPIRVLYGAHRFVSPIFIFLTEIDSSSTVLLWLSDEITFMLILFYRHLLLRIQSSCIPSLGTRLHLN